MLTREQLNERLVDYLYDEMTAADREAFESAVEQFPELRDEVAAHRRTREVVASYPLHDPPQATLDAIMRAARHEIAAPEAPPSVWDKILAMLVQPAFATAALVAGIGLTAFFTMDGLRQADRSTRATEPLPVVAVADPPKPASDNSTERTVEADKKTEEVALAAASAPAELAKRSDDEPTAPVPPPPADDPLVARGEGSGPDVRSALGRARDQKRVAQVKKRRKQKRSSRQSTAKKTTSSQPVQAAQTQLSEASLAKDTASDVAPRGRAPASPSPLVEAARASKGAERERPSAATNASATTHPGIGQAGTKSPANAEKRLRDRFDALVKAGKVAEAKRVLAELEKLPSVSKSRLQSLRRVLAKAQRSDEPSKAQSRKAATKPSRAEPAKPASEK